MNNWVRFGLVAIVLFVSGCSLPTNQLTAKERKADLDWAFTIFEHNYAPAEIKKNNFGVELSQIQADCQTLAAEDMDNQAFLALFQKCIHSFQDPHVGGQQLNSGILPEFANVAHLGFVTMRTKVEIEGSKVDALRVVAQLKGADTPFAPVIPGDVIIEVDGRSVTEHLTDEIIPYVNVGHPESNLSMASLRFAVRNSMEMPLPVGDDVVLKVMKPDQTVFTIKLPWIKEDLLAFETLQNPPEEETTEEQMMEQQMTGFLIAKNPMAGTFFGYHQLKDVFVFLESPIDALTNRVEWIAKTGFRMVKFNPLFNSIFKSEGGNGMDLAIRTRILPKAQSVDDLMDAPLFTAKVITLNDETSFAYIQLSEFAADDKVLEEWFRAMTAIEDKGIKSVVLDLIDNGGGSLVHGMRMVNMLREGQTLQLPSLQVRLNNNWMNSFKTQAAFSEDPYAKAIAKNVVRDLTEDQEAGKKVSRPLSISVLDPFFLQNPDYGLPKDVKIALLVNEFCVSMCDIFASVFQDNNMGIVIGQRTMGGGGNVAQHGLSPVSKLGVALTESMIISPKGKYLENEGVTPDIEIDMVADRDKGFEEAFGAALGYFTK